MWPFEYKYNVQCFWLKRILNIIIQAGIFREYRNKCFWRPKAQAGIFREYRNKCFWRPKCLLSYRQAFLESTEISASEDLKHRRAFLESTEISASEDLNALERHLRFAVVDIKREGSSSDYAVLEIRREMPFLLRFCTRKRSETYFFCNILFLDTQFLISLKYLKQHGGLWGHLSESFNIVAIDVSSGWWRYEKSRFYGISRG